MRIQNVSQMVLVVYADGAPMTLEPNRVVTVNSLDVRSMRLVTAGFLRILPEPGAEAVVKKEEKPEEKVSFLSEEREERRDAGRGRRRKK